MVDTTENECYPNPCLMCGDVILVNERYTVAGATDLCSNRHVELLVHRKCYRVHRSHALLSSQMLAAIATILGLVALSSAVAYHIIPEFIGFLTVFILWMCGSVYMMRGRQR